MIYSLVVEIYAADMCVADMYVADMCEADMYVANVYRRHATVLMRYRNELKLQVANFGLIALSRSVLF